MISAANVGATAVATEKMVNSANEYIIVPLRPYDSDRGPQIIGPHT